MPNAFYRRLFILGTTKSLRDHRNGAAPKAPATAGMIGSMIGRMHHVVLDCPDPAALAAFYSALLGLPVTYDDGDWAVVAANDTSSGLAFQRAPGNPPRSMDSDWLTSAGISRPVKRRGMGGGCNAGCAYMTSRKDLHVPCGAHIAPLLRTCRTSSSTLGRMRATIASTPAALG